MSYTQKILDQTITKNADQPEYVQAVREILGSLGGYADSDPAYEREGILERLVEAERAVIFRVPWVDDSGKVQVNRAYRVQHNSAIGPYKGGMRFHPSVNLSVIKFLGLEQTFKNALTGLPIGGGKGGADFDPAGKSDREIMSFCQSLMTELYRHLGPDTDVPAGDIGVGAREVGYMAGQYKRIANHTAAVLTGKGISYGGSLARTEATGYGLLYLVEAMLRDNGHEIAGKTVIISGAGNVATYAAEKAIQLGAKVAAISDITGYITDTDGIDVELWKAMNSDGRGVLAEYVKQRPNATFHPDKRVWEVPCHIALPCATQNELYSEDARTLIANGCIAVGEGANMPCTIEATNTLLEAGVLFAPAKAANAGGVATSALEMSQNSMRQSWTFEEVDAKLKDIMLGIYDNISTAAAEAGVAGNYVTGANIAGFKRVAAAMLAQGIV